MQALRRQGIEALRLGPGVAAHMECGSLLPLSTGEACFAQPTTQTVIRSERGHERSRSTPARTVRYQSKPPDGASGGISFTYHRL